MAYGNSHFIVKGRQSIYVLYLILQINGNLLSEVHSFEK